jgi:hypothetical protein
VANVQAKTQFLPKAAAELVLNIGGRDYRLVGKVVRIGRASDNDIVIDDKSVSRYHALISLENDKVILEDLKSRNGTRVNRAPIKRVDLGESAVIHIGDIEGVFYQRLKNGKASTKNYAALFSNLKPQAQQLKEKFQSLEPKQKKLAIASAAGVFLLALMVLASGNSSEAALDSSMVDESAAEATVADASAVVTRADFDQCLGLEDLGSFRQANSCFAQLPQTFEVQRARQRIEERQSALSEQRFKEGQQAFGNYYFDLAIQKWQEVLLIADENSQYFLESMKGIQRAEAMKQTL